MHILPQPPQLVTSLAWSTQVALQHDMPLLQAVPQRPQWAALEATSTHLLPQQVTALASPPIMAAFAHWSLLAQPSTHAYWPSLPSQYLPTGHWSSFGRQTT